jgi:hypothetical protein
MALRMVRGGDDDLREPKRHVRAGCNPRFFFSLQLMQNEVYGQKQQGRAATV